MSTTTPPWKLPPSSAIGAVSQAADSDPQPVRAIAKVDLTCPECGHVQSEPVRVVATQCRGCLKHYQVRDGVVVARAVSAIRLAKPGAHDANPPMPAPAVERRQLAPKRPVPPPMAWWKRIILRPAPPREANCFQCGRGFTAGAEAESTQCPGCGAYVSLRDHEIRESWTRELQTCGDVILHKEGTIRQTRIHCRNLTVHGRIAAEIVCRSNLVIHGGGRIAGGIRCGRLHVKRKAKVEFHDAVHADEILIEGEVRGVFHCRGTVTLAKGALLQGLVRAAAMRVRPGASHAGTLEIIEPGDLPLDRLAQPEGPA